MSEDQFETDRRYRAIKTFLCLAIMACAYIPICLIATLKYYLLSNDTTQPKKNITIVITGAKMYKSTLFVKWLGKAGYDIILVETEKFWCSGSKFSKYVKKFYTVADALSQPEQYVNDLLRICKENNAKMFIPACAPATEQLDSIVGSQLSSQGVKVLHAPEEIFEKLNDKHQFCEYMKELNLAVPESFIVRCNKEVFEVNKKLKDRILADGEEKRHKHTFILKNIEYDPVHRLDLFTLPAQDVDIEQYLKKIEDDGNGISTERPWTIQRFIDGDMWSSLQVQVEGQVCLYTCTKSSASCFNWAHEENQQIKDWNANFAKNVKINGIFTNDFIVDRHDGIAYAIECNPRLGSQVSLFHSNKDMAQIIIGEHPTKQVEPISKLATYTTLNELFALIDPAFYGEQSDSDEDGKDGYPWLPSRLYKFLQTVCYGVDPIFDQEDMLPFFMINFFQMPLLLLDTAIAGRPWKKIDFQIGKVVELGGY